MKKFHKIIVKYENISYNQNMKTIFRDLRKEKSLTQMELAKILNIDQTTVSKWEVGKAIPDYDTLQRLADFYNVSVDYLLGREVQSPAPEQKATEPLSDNAVEMLKTFNKLSNDSQIMCIGFAEQFLRHDLEQQQKTKDKNFDIRKIGK